MLELFNTTLSVLPRKLLRNDSQTIELLKDFYVKIFGNINNCKNVLIVVHGAGFGIEAPYITSLLNKFKDKNDTSIIVFDCLGYGLNYKSKKIFGPYKDVQNIFLDDIISFVRKNNKICNIYSVGFSFGAGALLAYLTDTQDLINNKNKDEIKQSFLISPTIIDYEEQIELISKNILSIFISIMHSKKSIKFWLNKFNVKKCLLILKNITNINSVVKLNGLSEYYKHSCNQKNQTLKTTVFLSKKDPITPWEDTEKNNINSHNHDNLYFLPGCGHIGFFTLSGGRIYEDIIYYYI